MPESAASAAPPYLRVVVNGRVIGIAREVGRKV
jgi:hypothetical protein